mmetsp:Transcript_113016/g.315796  ORF Transcript_113016/g.315796 Transcript_113016/m.315796 type:complete len:209 (-) Transcript_113016:274-900(-)
MRSPIASWSFLSCLAAGDATSGGKSRDNQNKAMRRSNSSKEPSPLGATSAPLRPPGLGGRAAAPATASPWPFSACETSSSNSATAPSLRKLFRPKRSRRSRFRATTSMLSMLLLSLVTAEDSLLMTAEGSLTIAGSADSWLPRGLLPRQGAQSQPRSLPSVPSAAMVVALGLWLPPLSPRTAAVASRAPARVCGAAVIFGRAESTDQK